MLLRIDSVSARLGLRKSAIYELIRRGELCEPLKLGRASLWPSSSIDAFIAERIAASQRKA
jgi:prophage regulatory protein